MQVQTAEVIDLQAYRQSRNRTNPVFTEMPQTWPYAMQPVLMWVPYWGLVPMMVVGTTGYGT
jgi:hypothetical protein